MLFRSQFNCADDHDIDEVKQHIASMESSLRTLNQQEKKYTTELDAALTQYAELQQQATDMDAMELDTARHAIRPDKEREAGQRLQATYGKKFDSGMLMQSRKSIAKMLNESVGPTSIRQQFYRAPRHPNKQCGTKQQEKGR